MQHLYFHKNETTKEKFFAAYEQLSQHRTHHILLESGRGGRYSVAGLEPKVLLQSVADGLLIQGADGKETIPGDPLIEMEKWMKPLQTERLEELPDFQGGVIGFLSYDYARRIENLPSVSHDDLEVPDLYFYYLDRWAVFDHQENTAWTMILSDEGTQTAEQQLKEWTGLWTDALINSEGETDRDIIRQTPAEIEKSMDEAAFSEAVEKIQAYISQGDVFQVNLSVRQSQQLQAEPYTVYKKLRELNPSPYMSYIHSPDFQIVSGSPELLVKKQGGEVSTRPIAGTRSRGKDEAEDEKLALELIHNEKERAEHVMLVDLERNDLGRVCRYGTVEVNEFMVIEKYSHVMHIVSNVRGTLDETKTGADLIRSVFPGGTITGAPKVRTMEIIEELEPVRRGIYTGSIGWIGVNGDMELNIVIRTMLVKEGKGHIQAGAGVVIDSNPKYEYKESLKKAKALWVAKARAEGEEA
ncbi:aminodeoxychorismate synthase, component I [Bacillus sp. KH172YL63]|uniref:aminodeoxychorismate synthase, component I n=1 Tax=Bacillus sp. KH172YL63 TaxID=2709784 RepID=UPI0013E487A0|nr:aminodeoxychorismate synthase, component I [Bacillus sp. KH172YL63]BCB01946.1 aminodeoxychorismate synthase, component I [Bacillus sp. KH172YL63]